MQEAKKDALALSKYFVSLPHPAKTTLMIIAVSFLFGVLFEIVRSPSPEPVLAFAGGLNGIVLLAVPALLSATGLFLMRRKAIFRRAAFLGLLTSICYGMFYLASFALSGIWQAAGNVVFVGFGVAFVLWYFLLLLAFDFRKSAFLFATMQMILFALFFLSGIGLWTGADPITLLVKMYFAAFVFLSALYVMFYIVSAPLKKSFGISGIDAVTMFLSQWLYGGKDLEEVFEEIGEGVQTLVWLAEFKGKGNNALFVVPYIHFGPFGNLGGSEFTSMISNELSEGKKDVFVFHGTATHDFNPVSSKEIGKVVAACRSAMKKLRCAPAKMSFSSCRTGTVRAQAYRINGSAFISYTRAPLTTEDVSLGLGLALLEKAKRHVKSAAVVDEHNAETGDISSVEVGSPIGFEMLDATDGLFSSKGRGEKFLFASASKCISVDALGKNGLKLALFARGKKLNVILLSDSNGILPEFRESLLELLESLGGECGYSCLGEVMTTDTHQINSVKGILNPLGSNMRGELMMAVRQLFYEAKEKLGPVSFDSAEERFNLRVFGTGQSAEIASTINSVVAIMRFVLPIILVASAVLLLWALVKI